MAQEPVSSILVTIRITVRIQESEVRNPHSLAYRKSYQWMDFDEILRRAGVWARDHLITFWWRSGSLSGSGSPDLDPGRTATLSTHRTDALSAAPMSSILVTIRISVRIQESEVRNPDSLDYRLCWCSAEVCALWALVLTSVSHRVHLICSFCWCEW